MSKYIIEQDRDECIGCGACTAVDEEMWSLNEEDGKATPARTQISEEELKKNMETAEACPVNVIHIKNAKTGEKLI